MFMFLSNSIIDWFWCLSLLSIFSRLRASISATNGLNTQAHLNLRTSTFYFSRSVCLLSWLQFFNYLKSPWQGVNGNFSASIFHIIHRIKFVTHSHISVVHIVHMLYLFALLSESPGVHFFPFFFSAVTVILIKIYLPLKMNYSILVWVFLSSKWWCNI